MEPSREQIGQVMEWWYDQRDRIAEAFGVNAKEVPAGAVWFLDIDYKPSEKDIAWAQRLAKELGLDNG